MTVMPDSAMTAAQDAALLQVQDLSIWRGEHLLVDALELTVPKGTILQIQGSNGSGKSTLLRALIGLAEFDEGEIRWCGEPVRRVREEMQSALVYLGHKAGIVSALTPLENLLALCPELWAASSTASVLPVRERVRSVLAELGIEDRIDLACDALSAGQKRRVSLARLRLQRAALWVLDEPLTSLDADGQEWVRHEIQRHVLSGGSLVFTTHQTLGFDALPVSTLRLGDEA